MTRPGRRRVGRSSAGAPLRRHSHDRHVHRKSGLAPTNHLTTCDCVVVSLAPPGLITVATAMAMTTIDQTAAFGVYILTYPGDFHLSTILVRSIRGISPGVPIMVIPGEGFDRGDHPFDVPVMAAPTGSFWPELGHMDRKFWAFQGPFETFLYLDADTICTRSLDPLVDRVARQETDFIF